MKMKYSKAEVIETREDFFPTPRLIKYNGRIYTAFGRLFAVRGDRLNCTEEEYRKLSNEEPWYQFSDWENLIGMYREKDA